MYNMLFTKNLFFIKFRTVICHNSNRIIVNDSIFPLKLYMYVHCTVYIRGLQL